MIDIYYYPTPNVHKITMFMEETGLPYNIIPIDIVKGEQFSPDFLKIAPNNRVPVIVDHDPIKTDQPLVIFESAAILLYLAEKTGKLLSTEIHSRMEALQWTIWQVAGLGPMSGQNGHFRLIAPEKYQYSIDRYTNETNRLYGVLNRRLEGREFVTGSDYSIADISSYPWIRTHEMYAQNLDDFPNLKRWCEAIVARRATTRAYAKTEGLQFAPFELNEKTRKILYGRTAATWAAPP